nr:MAG TPA: hypothetical protein [Caudoviricetes sp.]
MFGLGLIESSIGVFQRISAKYFFCCVETI